MKISVTSIIESSYCYSENAPILDTTVFLFKEIGLLSEQLFCRPLAVIHVADTNLKKVLMCLHMAEKKQFSY